MNSGIDEPGSENDNALIPPAPSSFCNTPEQANRRDGVALPVATGPGPVDATQGLRDCRQANRAVDRRKLAEGQFRSSDEVFHLMVNNIKDYGIIMLDPEGCIVTWNAGANAITGYQAEEVIGKHYSLFYLSKSDIESGKPERELAIADSTGRFAEEGWRVRKDGSPFWASIVFTAIRNPAGKLLGLAMVTHDMSERKLSEARDAAKTAQLTVANKELESFAYSVSHDLRAPLRHLDGFAELLRKNCYQEMDTQGQHYLDKITTSAQRMGHLIDDLLAFSRLLRTDVSRTYVRLQSLEEEVRLELEPDISARNIDWVIGDLPDVYGDRSMLRQVFVNLLSNALKYTSTRAKARIEIGCANVTEEEAVIFVRDNGVGFEMEYASNLFGVFQRLHSDEFEGTGVGLANVRRIVERHGGRVWGEGAVDQGATFYFALRLNRGDDSA
jgi:PAS domain S-box-containing protein